MDEFMTLLSLFLTPMAICACILVIYLWKEPFLKAVAEEERDAVSWMIIGVVINFTGAILDNVWWGLAWSFHYVDPTSSGTEFFFKYGVYSNTLSRQGLGIVGAMCHITSGSLSSNVWIKRVTYSSAIIGLLWVATLIFLNQSV